MPRLDTDGYLKRLAIADAGEPSVTGLRADNRSEWFAALADVFDLPLDDLDSAERDALWTRVRTAHDAFLTRKAGGLVTAS